MTAPAILCCGDAHIDMVPLRLPDGIVAYRPFPGGSCFNIAVALRRLGVPAGFVGALSTDFLGDLLRERFAAEGIDISRVTTGEEETTLALVSAEVAAPRYVFYDQASASRHWRPAPGLADLAGIEAVHFGSVTLIGEPAAGRYESFAREARRHCLVTLDPNCRPSLVRDAAAYRARIDRMARGSDIVRMSDEDADYLYPGRSAAAIAADLRASGVALVVVTAAAAGATAFAASGERHVPAAPVDVADTIGAGDTFFAAFLTALRQAGRLSRPGLGALAGEDLAAALRFAAKAAAVTCSRPGADPPRLAELEAVLTPA
ncbi:carbohydrate kinase [Aureimonas endophytica]|uniref:Carbohydrate kinase n=1 Tax=Aureimonas endophytica TaxID=2027858 RepID=A0A917E3R7_9HYPH|nr:PfkB family carbohydrate kinase [Aureimonas endophytica]GGD98635.1 carbohydrate kinase [Aureimonas endophytica]